MLERLKAEAESLGKPAWRPMLRYVAELHERSIHPPRPPFALSWEEIGPGYQASPAFGHWDIVHQILDVLPTEPDHARNQILNDLAAQQDDGLVPGSIWMKDPTPRWNTTVGHPHVWPVAVQEHAALTCTTGLIERCFEPLVRLIGWYERSRAAQPAGFYYCDILNHRWESGVDEGVRFDEIATGPFACIDATCHVYTLYATAANWAHALGTDPLAFARAASRLSSFIQNELFDPATGFFHDVWAVGKPQRRRWALEGMWPVVVGAAAPDQARRVVDEHLMNPGRFLTAHPLASVGTDDPRFELRMWRGPAWNSMTFWAARGMIRYGRHDDARRLLERALDASADQFERTGTIWEFYHPHGGSPETLQRKPQTTQNTPCRDYLGHNPLLAMARLWSMASPEQCDS